MVACLSLSYLRAWYTFISFHFFYCNLLNISGAAYLTQQQRFWGREQESILASTLQSFVYG